MSEALLQLTISRVDGAVFSGEVLSVTVPGVAGEMTILAHHEALISPLKEGTVIVRMSDGTDKNFAINTGTFEISNNHATVLI